MFHLNKFLKKEVKHMKKIVARILAAVALAATGAASLGCFWVIVDEPEAIDCLKD